MQPVDLADGQSTDIVSENIERLKELFPDAFSEGSVDFDALRQLLGDANVLDEGEEKYGLNWHGKKKARQIALTPSTGTLLPCPEESVDWDTTQNLFIEGDNLEVLKLLQKSYANKVKMIYIDPPYNTGKEFIYPDKFQENLDTYLKYTGQIDDEGFKVSSNTETTGKKHTNWLSMIFPRLKLAKQLLSSEGVIFISIDDNEQFNLRYLCNEIFGEENFVAVLPTIMNLKGNPDNYAFSDTHEYTVVYAKDKAQSEFYQFKMDEDELNDWVEDEFGLYKRADTLRRTGQDASREKRPKGWFPVFIGKDSGQIYVTDTDQPQSPGDITIWPKTEEGEELSWTWSKQKITVDNHNLMVVDGRNGKNIYKKQRPQLGDLPTKKPKTIFYKPEYSTSTATSALKSLVGKKIFDGPKPVPYLTDLIEIGSSSGDIILDFFAGSGSLAHAGYYINARDNSDRRVISVQLPEICDENSEAGKAGFACISSFSQHRIRAAIKAVKGQFPYATCDLGYKLFRLSYSSVRAWNPDPSDLEQSLLSHEDHLTEGRAEQDILYELLLKRGVDLAVPIENREVAGKVIYSIGYGVLFACLDDSITKEQVEEIGQGIVEWHRELAPSSDTHVFFRDSAFSDDVSKTNMAAILEQNGISHVRSL